MFACYLHVDNTYLHAPVVSHSTYLLPKPLHVQAISDSFLSLILAKPFLYILLYLLHHLHSQCPFLNQASPLTLTDETSTNPTLTLQSRLPLKHSQILCQNCDCILSENYRPLDCGPTSLPFSFLFIFSTSSSLFPPFYKCCHCL